jgi:hypothetical protein
LFLNLFFVFSLGGKFIMKRFLVAAVAAAVIAVGSVSTFAVSVDSLVKFTGDTKLATLYIPAPFGKGQTINLGFGAAAPVSGKAAAVAVLGIGNWPIMGGIDTDLNLSYLGEFGAGTNRPNAIQIDSLVVSKTWSYKVVNGFSLGVTVELLNWSFAGSAGIHTLLANFYPVVGATLDF